MVERHERLRACLDWLGGASTIPIRDDRRRQPSGRRSRRAAGARVVREPLAGISAARNRGLDAAGGEIIAFTDDDVEVDPAWLLAIALRMLAHPEEACVTGHALPRELETPAQVGLEEYYGGFGPLTFEPVSHRLRVAPSPGALLSPATVDAIGKDGGTAQLLALRDGQLGHGANMAFRTQALRELAAGFSVALGAGDAQPNGEELDVFARLIWRRDSLGFEPAALVNHTHRRDSEAWRQIENYGMAACAASRARVGGSPPPRAILGTVPRGVRRWRGYRQRAALSPHRAAKECSHARARPPGADRHRRRAGGIPPRPPPIIPMRPPRLRRSLTFNAASLMTATVVTNGLGLAFWAEAARLRSPGRWARAAAAVAALTLLATISQLNLTNVFLRLLPTGAGSMVGGSSRADISPWSRSRRRSGWSMWSAASAPVATG